MDSLDLIHMKIHGLRMIPKYKPTQFEQEINRIISEDYQEKCRECKLKLKIIDAKDELNNLQPHQRKGFLRGIFE